MLLDRLSSSRKRFEDLSTQEILALAISSEEDDARIYRSFAQKLEPEYPASSGLFQEMASEEDEHRSRLIELHRRLFGDVIPLVRREHIAGFYARKPVWLSVHLSPDQMRQEAIEMENSAHDFYYRAAQKTEDAETRQLLGSLAAAEKGHMSHWQVLLDEYEQSEDRSQEDIHRHKQFLLTWVQPGLAGLMDGSVSTLAPIFAAAFATGNTWETFLVGLAASVGAGISMGFTEISSDDGVLSGRGSPWKRGLSTGVMTTLGGLGHAVPYLIPDFWTATTLAIIIVFFELWAIAWIQNKYMETPFLRAAFQVVLGGSLVFAAGYFIGNV